MNADAILAEIVRAYEAEFPGRVSYYIIGSYADGSAVPLSDLDLILVFKEKFRDTFEEQGAHQLAKKLTESVPVRLDLTPRGEDAVESMYAVIRVGLKQGSRLFYGDDLRDQMSLPSPQEYLEDVRRGALFFIARLHGVERVVALPLTYPDANDPFFGYTRKVFAEWYPPKVTAGTKVLVATVSRIATALVAAKTGRFVSSKQQAINCSADSMDEPWASFVPAVYQRCKLDWKYLIPSSDSAQAELKHLCHTMLDFENFFCRDIPIL